MTGHRYGRRDARRLIALLLLAGPAPAQTLDAIRGQQRLDCGTVSEIDDWNSTDIHGDLSALGADICRAVAAAILGDAAAVRIQAFPAEPEAIGALRDNAIQLAVGISPDATTAAVSGIAFGPPVFFDTQRVMTSRSSGIADLSGLKDQLVCALDLRDPARTLQDELAARGIPYANMAHSEQGEMDAAIAVRRCAAGTAAESRLAQSRANFHARSEDFVFVPERFGLEPMVPAYRYGDQAFGLVVDWTVHALIEAEALGITQANVTAAATRDDMRAQRLLGGDFATAQALGLAHDWAAKVIAATGNYGEVFARDVGKPLHLGRGYNALWTDGGLMRPLPLR